MGHLDNLAEWLQRIDRTTKAARIRFGELSTTQLNWKPSPSVWSIAQVLDHMMVVNGTMYPTFDALLRGDYQPSFATKLPLLPSLFGGMILKSQAPANRKKSKTMPLWQPASSDIAPDIAARFTEHQEDLKRRYQALDSKVKGNPVISSPAASFIVYRLEDAMELLVRHEERHLLQADEVKTQMSSLAT